MTRGDSAYMHSDSASVAMVYSLAALNPGGSDTNEPANPGRDSAVPVTHPPPCKRVEGMSWVRGQKARYRRKPMPTDQQVCYCTMPGSQRQDVHRATRPCGSQQAPLPAS